MDLYKVVILRSERQAMVSQSGFKSTDRFSFTPGFNQATPESNAPSNPFKGFR
jgi:hypothetical protein